MHLLYFIHDAKIHQPEVGIEVYDLRKTLKCNLSIIMHSTQLNGNNI